jgi:8-oxo-dGTP pyrophosphatase MutT (NUDIX family)
VTAASHGSADTDDGAEVPGWLNDLARSAERMAVPYALRPPPGGGRPAAVLILFGDGSGGPDLLLVQRSPWLRQHAGQPAFPGGGIDSADQGPVGAALREAAEEALVEPAGVEVLAVLPELYIWRSGFSVTPVLAWWRRPAPVGPGDPVEVSSVARVRVAELADPANRLMIRYPSGQASPAFRAGGMLIWGFTALLVDRLLALGGWELPWDTGNAEDLPAGYLALAQGGQTGQADPGGAVPGGAEPGRTVPGGAVPGGAVPGGAEPDPAEPGLGRSRAEPGGQSPAG